METTQVQKLKLNVTNINSFLVNSNKDLRRLRVEKNKLFVSQEKQIKVQEKENKIEKTDFGIGSSFNKIKNAVTSTTGSIIDKIKEFFGLILLGTLLNNLPRILSQLENFFNSPVIKTIGSIITVIGNGIMTFAKIATEFPKSAQTQFLKTKDDLEKKFDELEGIYSALIPDLEKYNQQKNGQSPSTQTPTTTPVRPGQPLNPQTNTRILTSPTAPGTTTLPAFSKGGTVKSESNRKVTSSAPTPGGGQSGKAKRARQASDRGFTGFKVAVDKINENTKLDENNATAFEKMSYNFKTLTSLMSGKTPSTTPPGPPGSTPPGPTPPDQQSIRQQQYSGKSYASGAYIGETGDTDGNQTGLDMNLSGGIGAPIYAPFDLIYKNNGTDGMPSVGLQGTPDVRGPAGKGFGYYGAYYFKRGNKEYEIMMGHFKSLPLKGAKEGQVIPKGTLLGYQGASGRTIGKGNQPYPHISLHVNGVGFRASNSVLDDVSKDILKGKPSPGSQPPASKITPNQTIPTSKYKFDPYDPNPDPIKTGAGQLLKALQKPGSGGGNRLLNSTSNRGNQSLFIYAVQPVETFIPFPYPMPIPQKTVDSSSPPPKPSALWRA